MDSPTDPAVAYAICRLSDIPSQRAAGFHLMVVGDDGKEKPFPSWWCAGGGRCSAISTNAA